MSDLSQRQIDILKCLTEEFIETADPVGSEFLDKKFGFGVCPATLRNEMAKLAQMGYIKKKHASSGRMPTAMGIKFYVRQLMKPKKLSISEEIGAKDKLWEHRNDFESMAREATKELAKRTRQLAVLATQQGGFYVTGIANLLDEPEFFDIDVAKSALSLIDNGSFWMKLIEDIFNSPGGEEFHLLIGSELGGEFFEPCGLVYQDYRAGPNRGIIGIIGPARITYDRAVPLVNYFAKLLSEAEE